VPFPNSLALATSTYRLAADCAADCAGERRIYCVGGIHLTASGGIWAVGDASGFGEGYREHGSFVVGEVYLAAYSDTGVAIDDQVGYGTLRRGYCELSGHGATAGIVESAVDVSGYGNGPALRAGAWVVRQGDGNIAVLASRGGGASR